MDKIELLSLIEKTVPLCKKAGEIALRYYKADDLQVDYKIDAGNSPVTQADKEIDAFLQAELMALTPTFGWLSEESVDDTSRLEKETVWIVDPIDGTQGFVHQKDDFVVSVGLAHQGKAVLGVIYNPVYDEMFTAVTGGGVYLNGEKMPERTLPTSLKEALLLISITEERKGMWQKYAGDFQTKIAGSMAYKMALLAAGKADAMVTLRPKSQWDVVAGQVLCEESGLKMTDFQGADIIYNVASHDIDRAIIAPHALYTEVKETFTRKEA